LERDRSLGRSSHGQQEGGSESYDVFSKPEPLRAGTSRAPFWLRHCLAEGENHRALLRSRSRC